MTPKPKHDIYLRDSEGSYYKIAWLKGFKEFELMIGFYGFNGEDPILANIYEDRIVTLEELKHLEIGHKEASKVEDIPVDHFTFHNDKKHLPGVFHLSYPFTHIGSAP